MPWAASAVFLALAVYLIPTLGLQNDETLFANGIYPPVTVADSLATPIGRAPLMLVSYTGSLKTWLYALVFWLVEPSTWSIRLPVALLGAATVALFARQTLRAAGPIAALVGAALLATDPAFLLTVCFDWGPVALQLFLVVGTVSAFAACERSGRRRWALLGGFLAGLALWNKALFLWNVAGLAIATAAVYGPELRRLATPKTLAAAACGFVAGAWPLLLYNWRTAGATFTRNAGFELTWPYLVYKLRLLVETLDGSALFRYMLAPDAQAAAPAVPLAALFLGVTVTALASPALRRNRLPAWALLAFWGSYAPMLLGRDVGVGSHHVALLWPLPQLALAVVAADWSARSVSRRAAVAAALAAVVALNLSFLAEFRSTAANGGPAALWTDAIGRLHERVAALEPRGVVFLDWGMLAQLRALGQGRLPLVWGADVFLEKQPRCSELLEEPGYVFVDHVDGKRVFEGVRESFDEAMRDSGHTQAALEIIRDRAERPIFEVFRVAPATARSTD